MSYISYKWIDNNHVHDVYFGRIVKMANLHRKRLKQIQDRVVVMILAMNLMERQIKRCGSIIIVAFLIIRIPLGVHNVLLL